MTSLAHAYYLVLLAYAAFYAAVYLLPLARAAGRLRPGDSLKRLTEALAEEHRVLDAERARTAAPTPAGAATGDGAPDDERADAAGDEPDTSAHRRSTERLLTLPALRARYDSPLVQEAVDQLRVQYPGGAYQHVALDRLPSFSAYAERLGSARTMAGLFVLLGLLLTMIRLDGVVDQIGGAAAGVSMTPESFLASMGQIMTGVGGAFLSSIWGLGLMLGFLLVVALVDRRTQNGLNAAEAAFAGGVVPGLADLHTRLMPDLTLGDLLAETGLHLRTLNRTVDGMTDGMARSLAGLGERIETVLRDFGTFQDQYVQLNDLLKYIREASENLSRTTGRSTARRSGSPTRCRSSAGTSSFRSRPSPRPWPSTARATPRRPSSSPPWVPTTTRSSWRCATSSRRGWASTPTSRRRPWRRCSSRPSRPTGNSSASPTGSTRRPT